MDSIDSDVVIRNKLAVDQRPLRKLMRKFQTLKLAVETKQDEAVCSSSLESFLIELATYSTIVLHKQSLIQTMNSTQQLHFDNDLAAVLKRIEDTKNDIEEFKVELVHEGVKRAQQLEYDQVARLVLEFPSRDETEGNMATLALEIASLEAQQKKLDQAFEFRKTLLHNVVSSVYTMKDAISGGSNAASKQQHENKRGNSSGVDGNVLVNGDSSFSLIESDLAMEEGEEGEEREDEVHNAGGRRGSKSGGNHQNNEDEDEEGAYEDKMDES
ncbi:hypothetical protein BDR26DRAFT_887947, partial [Obelidium mucronatum]